jgi:hypothetical protein
MQQVAEWLEKLGLGQYAQRFAENDITFSILPDLTDQHLEKIGVASLGHRLQLLRAIAKLNDRLAGEIALSRRSSTGRKQKRILSKRSQLHAANKLSPGNSAQR